MAERLRSELAVVRRHGYAVDDIENEEDTRCVAAPVFDHGGSVITAMSISGPSSRVTRDRVAGIGALLVASARGLSECLGAQLTPRP